MNVFDNMKVSMKLGVLILIALVSLCISSGIGYYYHQQAAGEMSAMYQNLYIPNDKITGCSAAIRAVNSYLLDLMLTTDTNKNQQLKKSIKDTKDKIDQTLAEVEKLPMDEKATSLLSKVKDAQLQYRDAGNQVVNLAMQNKNAEAYALYSSKVEPLALQYVASIDAFSNYYTQLGEKMNADNQASVATASKIAIAIFMIQFIILCWLGVLISRKITKPLQAMVLGSQKLAEGDFRESANTAFSKDEIGQLGISLVNMKQSLRAILKQVNESAEHVAASSEELTANAEQSSQAVTQVAGSITNVAEGAEKTSKAVDETTSVVEQLSAGIQQAAASSNKLAEQAAQAAGKAKDGKVSVEKAVNQMTQIEKTVNNSAGVVAKLGERSKEIGQIVDTISGIAGQTNLLALNAAIEAARAGEQGRGFAVVAEEVRKLAEQSQEAAKKIATLIGEIQGDTDRAVVAMDEGTREVKVGTEVVTTAGKAFEEIAALGNEVSGQVQEISAVMEQMASGSQQIVTSVKEIDEHSKNAVGQSQTVSAATEEQSASMEEIASASESLAKLAQELNTVVSKFRF